jgi:23S rRNA (adenine2030-N6)-methyltransferase
MNYRHAYHAGNFADVLKHAVLIAALDHLQRKEAPLFLLDTHAGPGRYPVRSREAVKTNEIEDGFFRLLGAWGQPDFPVPLVSYLSAVLNPAGIRDPKKARRALKSYPGSPQLIAAKKRQQDRFFAFELHPEDHPELAELVKEYTGTQARRGDGFKALLSLTPPQEKRGLVLIDPPFEEKDEFVRLAATFGEAYRKWATGVYLIWYPIKDRAEVERFYGEVSNFGASKLLAIEFDVDRQEGLSACGLLFANAPHSIETDWRPVVEWLARTLAQGPNPAVRMFTLPR